MTATVRVSRDPWAYLILPGLAVLALFFLLPLGMMVLWSVTDPSPTNFAIFLSSDVYVLVLLHTVVIAALCTLICLVLGYPYAYAMMRAGPLLRPLLTIAIIVPFWSSVLVRSYAWLVLLRDTGVLNSTLLDLGLLDTPLRIVRTNTAVVIAMCHILLPFMVFPVHAAMLRIDRNLLPAASVLGARPFRALRKVFVPLSLPGVYAGCLVVFVVALGFFVVPAMVGGPRSIMFSEMIVEKVYDELAFGVGAAMAIVLIATGLMAVALANRFVRVGDAFSAGVK